MIVLEGEEPVGSALLAGFEDEAGLMRNVARTPEGDYESLIPMSMLEPEWRERGAS